MPLLVCFPHCGQGNEISTSSKKLDIWFQGAVNHGTSVRYRIQLAIDDPVRKTEPLGHPQACESLAFALAIPAQSSALTNRAATGM